MNVVPRVLVISHLSPLWMPSAICTHASGASTSRQLQSFQLEPIHILAALHRKSTAPANLVHPPRASQVTKWRCGAAPRCTPPLPPPAAPAPTACAAPSHHTRMRRVKRDAFICLYLVLELRYGYVQRSAHACRRCGVLQYHSAGVTCAATEQSITMSSMRLERASPNPRRVCSSCPHPHPPLSEGPTRASGLGPTSFDSSSKRRRAAASLKPATRQLRLGMAYASAP